MSNTDTDTDADAAANRFDTTQLEKEEAALHNYQAKYSSLQPLCCALDHIIHSDEYVVIQRVCTLYIAIPRKNNNVKLIISEIPITAADDYTLLYNFLYNYNAREFRMDISLDNIMHQTYTADYLIIKYIANPELFEFCRDTHKCTYTLSINLPHVPSYILTNALLQFGFWRYDALLRTNLLLEWQTIQRERAASRTGIPYYCVNDTYCNYRCNITAGTNVIDVPLYIDSITSSIFIIFKNFCTKIARKDIIIEEAFVIIAESRMPLTVKQLANDISIYECVFHEPANLSLLATGKDTKVELHIYCPNNADPANSPDLTEINILAECINYMVVRYQSHEWLR